MIIVLIIIPLPAFFFFTCKSYESVYIEQSCFPTPSTNKVANKLINHLY